MASSPRRHVTTPQSGTNAIAHFDPDDLAMAVLSVDPRPAATPGSQDFADPHVDWLCFVDWPVAVAVTQTAVPRGLARAGPAEPIEDAVPIAIDAPVVIVAEPTIVVAAAAADCQHRVVAAVAAVDRPVATIAALVAEEDSAIDATVAAETAAVAAVC